ncbi:hypothetical protein [Glycomyces salinus]|uniref:hypothetical protein n=1 Tax=Glycomyces salinus TaxID=980294 RepID=UPI0018ED25BD|nr:hypothetical protein [Glycomyces salinus]
MSEQQSGAGYPQQPTSGQPQQQGYPPQYASPQAQYQAQQQYAAYAPQGPSLFDKLGVPSMPAILGLSGLGALLLAGLITGTSDDTVLAGLIGGHLGLAGEFSLGIGLQNTLVGVIVMFALTLFAGEKLRMLWKTLALAGVVLFLTSFLLAVLALPDGDSASDASAWIGALLLIAAYGLFATGAVMVPSSEAAAKQQAEAAQAAQQQQAAGYPQQQQAQQPQATQQNQWPQPPQQ